MELMNSDLSNELNVSNQGILIEYCMIILKDLLNLNKNVKKNFYEVN